ncbi:MAG: GGDEF domain-containing protein [Lachnospiraceae bacterium]|nr:GGDEF domain-containing protein [Lachnospiraceae bacterium]
MDYSELIEGFQGIACVLSLKKSAEKDRGEVTIAAANRNYLASVNKLDEEFVPDRPYTFYIPYDPNFEALTYNCIYDGKITHQYVNADLYKAWIDIYMIPLETDEEGISHCLFTYEMTPMSDSDKLIDISARTAYMVLKTCIKLKESGDFSSAMNSIVKDIRNQCESDGCAVILTNQEDRKIDYLFFDHDGKFAPADKDVFFKPEFYNIVEKWRDIIGGSNCFIISGEEELKEVEKKDVNWYNSLIYSGINNLVLYPMRVGDNLYGYIFATNFNSDKVTFIREVMELNSFVLSTEVENFRMHQKLEILSRKDMLTGVLNRNAMNKKIDDITCKAEEISKGIGVIYADVNGLKRVNDTLGHDEGDKILKKVASRLKSVFSADDIYRAGGDEFLIIITDRDKNDFYSLFEQLKSFSEVKGEPAFALGAYYGDKDNDINSIMHIADADMYKNKAEYYKSHPEINRRKE